MRAWRWHNGLTKFVQEEKISKEKADELRANYVWLPKEYEIIERLLPKFARGAAKLIELIKEQYSEFIYNHVEIVKSQFSEKPVNIMDVLAVLFVMEYKAHKVWNFDSEEWVDTQNK